VEKRLESHLEALRDLEASRLAALYAMAADVALVVDAQGAVREVLCGVDAPESSRFAESFRGRPFIDTVTPESRPKVQEILRDARDAPTRWRELNHTDAAGVDHAMLYRALPAGEAGETIVVGRDLDGIATLQQRLVQAQRSLEQDYWRRRRIETRYRLLFRVAAEGVLVVDAVDQRILESNASACQLLDRLEGDLDGRRVVECFADGDRDVVEQMFGALRGAGRADPVAVTLAGGEREASLAATLLDADGSLHYLLRITPVGVEAPVTESPRARQLLELVERGADGVAVASDSGTIVGANRAFLELLELASEEQVRGEPLDRWLGRTSVDMKVLLSNLREFGSLRHFVTRARGEYGADTEVEISAVSLQGEGEARFGIVVRDLAQRPVTGEPVLARATPKSIQHLTELVGRVPLKEVIRESSDIIERLCIDAALELTGDNRASAAEMLGLSRQSLYVKLRRHGLMNPDSRDR
jgi:transcriptional regulator PpsR